ncbi:MAG: hypothetical protein U1B83_02530 [Candidatus Cloacimonadaceae bacterium]|nr:hypothetical protein [Candidatus Cloacimonadaceae bacterium]
MTSKLAAIILCALLFGALISSCTINRQAQTIDSSLADLRNKLDSEQMIERQFPFAIREFDPYLDGKWIGQAVSYGCYREGQAPWGDGPSKAEILEDLNIIKAHWNLIRVYNADDDTQNILEVIRANALPIKVMLGIWLENEDNKPAAKSSNIHNILRGIELCKRFPEIIRAVNVGNETQVYWSGHRLRQEALIRYIRAVRSHIDAPVTTADDYNFWNKQESKAVADELDFIVTHIYPLWNGKTLANAISWLDDTYDEVARVHPYKHLVLGEIGWATNYNPDKKGDGEQGTLIKGEVSVSAQEEFLFELDAWINAHKITTFLFEVFDEPWKGGGEASGTNEIEKNWGLFYMNRSPKLSFINYLAAKNLTD